MKNLPLPPFIMIGTCLDKESLAQLTIGKALVEEWPRIGNGLVKHWQRIGFQVYTRPWPALAFLAISKDGPRLARLGIALAHLAVHWHAKAGPTQDAKDYQSCTNLGPRLLC